MNGLSEKLRAQLDSAHLAIDALNRDRERLRAAVSQATSQAESLMAQVLASNASNAILTGERDELHAELEQLQAQQDSIAALKEAIRQRDVAYEFLIEEFTNSYLSDRNSALFLSLSDAERDTLKEQVRALLLESQQTVEQLGGKADLLRRESEQFRHERDAAIHALNAVYASRSWRLTRPVRASLDVLRFLQRLPGRAGRFIKRNVQSLPGRAARFIMQHVRSLPGRAVRFAKQSSRRVLSKIARVSYRGLHVCGNAALNTYTRLARSWRMRFGTPRTLWGITPILTLPVLAQCDRLLGLKSQTLVFNTYYITQNFDINLKKICEYVYAKHPFWGVRLHKVIFRIALTRYDVYHYFCDRGIMLPNRRIEINEDEMRAITHFGHRLYTYTYGADVRTRQATLRLGKYNYCSDCPEPMKFCTCDDSAGEGNIQRISQYATAMLALGDMVHYVPGCRNFHFWPLDLSKIAYVGSAWSGDRPLRIAHAPNHSHFKGTHYLIAAIDKLVAEGRPIELVSVSGVPNHEVLKLFASCDVVADQFIGGLPGYAAMEAMSVGKPVLCYLRDETMVIDSANCPIINTWPDTVYDTLRACLDGQLDLAELGLRSRNYVEYYYSLEAVAARLGELYIETAGFPDRVNRRIGKKVNELRAKLPPLMKAEPPVPWSATRFIDLDVAEPQRTVA